MLCEHCRNGTLHTMSNSDREQHIARCAWCADSTADAKLDELLRKLERPLPAPDIWARIEKELPQKRSSGPLFVVLKAAAVILVVALAALLLLPQDDADGRLFTWSSSQRAQWYEQQYSKAIAEMEKEIGPQIAEMPLELSLLYRDRLAVIDMQIEACRRTLELEPGNVTAHRYLLAAMKEKKETLKEIEKTLRNSEDV